MASAPMKYQPDGSVDWGNMWDTFCVLAREGGPAHRASMLYAQQDADTSSPGYQFAVDEIVRGVNLVSGLTATAGPPGWAAIQCDSAAMAAWLAETIEEEQVQARAAGATLFVPVGDYFTLKGEIKNVITVVAKTAHYWREHLPIEVKRTLAVQAWLDKVRARARLLLDRGDVQETRT